MGKQTKTKEKFLKKSIETKQAVNLLLEFERLLLLGYSDENYIDVAKVYKQLSPCLDIEEYKMLGIMWRKVYTDSIDLSTIRDGIGLLKARLESPISNS